MNWQGCRREWLRPYVSIRTEGHETPSHRVDVWTRDVRRQEQNPEYSLKGTEEIKQLSGDNLKKTHVLPSRSNLFVTEHTAKFGGVVSWQRVEFTATSPSPRARNVWIIRSLGRDDEILRECFDRRREQVEWGSTFCSLHEHTAAPSGEHTVPK